MIVDVNFGGVFIPGLVVLALVALIATITTVRFCSATDILRLFASRPLTEIATFLIIYGLFIQCLPRLGWLP